MRIAHATDIHWTIPAPFRRLPGKRLLGAVNQVVKGRAKHFERHVQQALVEHIVALDPDLVVISGDLTTSALEDEFELAREALTPVLERFPTFVIPGNHDVYTRGAKRDRRIEQWFGEWMHRSTGSDVGRLDLDNVTVIGIDPNRPGLLSSGLVPAEQLATLEAHLRDPDLAGRFVLMAIHYPILNRDGSPYDGLEHGLRNARELIALLERVPFPPQLVVHGHAHHGFHVTLPTPARPVEIYNAGSSGYAFLPEKRRAACMNLYTVQGSELAQVERFMYDGAQFAPEPGGAYATGR